MAGIFDPAIFDAAIFDVVGAPAGDPLPAGFLVALVEPRYRAVEPAGPVATIVDATLRATQRE